jgi:hypothetical protein
MIGPDDLDAMRPECPMPPGPDLARLIEAAAGRLWGEKLPADSALQRMVAEVERLRGVLARIADASQYYADGPIHQDDLAYAHDSTARLARAALREGDG